MKTILLIEDNPDICDNTKEILELSGYGVLTASNGRDGIDLALKEIPDLILCDIMMPVMNGFDVFTKLNQHLQTSRVPFVFLTAKAETADKKYGISLGADDYITKPFDEELLLTIVRAKIEKCEKLRKESEIQLLSYIQELEEMLHMTSHKIRAPLCTCIGFVQLLEKHSQQSLSEEEIQSILHHIKHSVVEMDNLTKDMTHFLQTAKGNKREQLGQVTPPYIQRPAVQ